MELWEYTSEMLDCFWKRWNSEYLLALREQYKRSHKHPRLEEKWHPKLNDYVIIHDDSLKRGQWKSGQITGSPDDSKRTVQIRLANRETITRPINRISPLEISTPQNQPSTYNEEANRNDNQRKSTKKESSLLSMMTNSTTTMMNFCTIAALTILFTFITGCTASSEISVNHKCPDTITIAKKIVYADQCLSKGIAVASVKESSTNAQYLCWFPIICSLGHFPTPLLPNSGYCGRECSCSTWTKTCSYYNG
ncbi:hypothetical protein ANCCAN_08220 [Ancylostoma caninum]|uniref:DUF5641 domain-containing protein n=1 Tax=Ancylostoma caninum TaxID=29170 RepID=A0A368GRT8_ANCCA|nr:hypothetical protein ANCCAN_08220 [Ancylostoma caninum]